MSADDVNDLSQVPDAESGAASETIGTEATAPSEANGPDFAQPTLPGAGAATEVPDVSVPDPKAPVNQSHAIALTPAAPEQPKRNVLLTTLVSVLGAIVLVVGAGAVGALFFESHAKPGTEVAGRDITGFSQTQVRDVTTAMADNYQVTLQLNGQQVKATPAQVGMSFNVDQTVADAMDAGQADAVAARYNPFDAKSVPLSISVDQSTLETYLDNTFITAGQRSVPADVSYDATQKKYVVVPGQPGTQADGATVAAELAKGEGYGSPLTVATMPEAPLITDDAAQAVADAANKQLASQYVLTAGGTTYTIPSASIAAWTVLTPDPAKGTIDRSVDTAKVKADLPAMLTKNLTVPMVPEQILLGPDGKTALGVSQDGMSGTKVANPTAVTDSVITALSAGKGLDLKVSVVSQNYTTEKVPMAPEYLVPHGEKWVEVDRSSFTVTRWEGTTKLSTWSVIIGRPATPTYLGVFHVWEKLPLQDMTGYNADGSTYNTPNVPWIAYFNNDIALHGNYWVATMGQAASHGCVGMTPANAKIMYDWIDVGTMVVVHE